MWELCFAFLFKMGKFELFTDLICAHVCMHVIIQDHVERCMDYRVQELIYKFSTEMQNLKLIPANISSYTLLIWTYSILY